MRHVVTALACIAWLAALTGVSDARKDRGPRAAVDALIAAAAEDDAAVFEDAIGTRAGRDVPEERRTEEIGALRLLFREARVEKVRTEEKEATVRMATKGRAARTVTLRLGRDGERWRLASLTQYVTAGADLAARTGQKPARVTLDLRTTNGPYGTSAYCFRYATQDAKACKNRVDLWACHNEDFHARRTTSLVDMGKGKLRSVDAVPMGVEWSRTLPIEVGHVYVAHCDDPRDRDFYVKFRVRSFQGSQVEIEWTLLTGGFGAPADIHTPEVLTSMDGADGTDGLCGRHAR